MSAIKTSILKGLFLMFLLLTFFSCSKEEKTTSKADQKGPETITFIGMSTVGGRLGNYNIIKITQDSIHVEKGNSNPKNHKELHQALQPKDWQKLTSSFLIEDLNHIKSSESIQAIDGMDETFQIKTSRKSHVYVNTYNDSIHYPQFEKFKMNLNKIIPQ
ncbi:hypothetical protein [Chryseobacterium sp.]|uniref:hypothetical protein n=1 Tax=Chryseobacterium sp. TaxID=1871047 RepID=UPI00388EDC0F